MNLLGHYVYNSVRLIDFSPRVMMMRENSIAFEWGGWQAERTRETSLMTPLVSVEAPWWLLLMDVEAGGK